MYIYTNNRIYTVITILIIIGRLYKILKSTRYRSTRKSCI